MINKIFVVINLLEEFSWRLEVIGKGVCELEDRLIKSVKFGEAGER